MEGCDTPVGEAPPETGLPPVNASGGATKQSYTDNVSPQQQAEGSSDFASYAVEVLNRERRGAGTSNQVRVPLVRTLPPPKDFQAKVTAEGVVLSWTDGVPAQTSGSLRYGVRIYRKPMGNLPPSLIGEVPLGADPSLTDTHIEWEKTYEYRGTVVTKIDEPNKPEVQIEGDDGPAVRVFADDVFPPTVPTGLQAVFSGPGQPPFVDLIWAPDTDADLAGYNVYRREAEGTWVKLNADPVKNPAYRDSSVEPGKAYTYSVSAVDVRGNESARSEEATETAPQ